MPLVAVNKALRRKSRPTWVEVTPKDKIVRDALKISVSNEAKFSRAFRQLSGRLLTEDVLREVKRRLEASATVDEVLNAIPFMDSGHKDAEKIWEDYKQTLSRSYANTMQESGQQEWNRRGVPFGFEVEPIEKKIKAEVSLRVPVNPFSMKWIKDRAAKLVVDVSDSQRQAMRSIVTAHYGARGTSREALREIEGILRPPRTVGETISDLRLVEGLTDREAKAVFRRRDLAIEAGVPLRNATAAAGDYSLKLLAERSKRIARTETIDAQNQGLQDSWKLAKEGGLVPEGTKKKWVAIMESGRTCQICQELEQHEPVPLEEPFYSSILGTHVMRPPSHPNCRCSQVLVFPGEI